MFRFMRFYHFLTKSHRRVGDVALENLLNRSIYSLVPPGTYPVRETKAQLRLYERVESTELQAGKGLSFSASGNYWFDYLTSDKSDINWDECLAQPEVPKEPLVNTHAILLIVCRKKKFYNCAVSLFNYLWDKNEITPGILYLFCNIFLEDPDRFRSCEDRLFQVLRSSVLADRIAVKYCSKVLLQSSKYLDIVLQSYKSNSSYEQNHTAVVMGLIEAGKINEAVELYIHNNFRTFSTEKTIWEYFLQETKKGIQTIPDICKFLEGLTYFKTVVNVPYENEKVIKELFEVLNSLDKDYSWMVQRGSKSLNVCSCCKGKLEQMDVSQEEIDLLIKDLEEHVIFQETIFMKSNHKEWNKFVNFIKYENYNLVMDSLNVKYFLRDYVKFEEFISKITSMGLTPFLLGRAHFQTTLEFRLIKNKFPIFLTDNLSDDDVFVLYAALKKGKGCFTLSNDKMAFCYTLLSTPELKNIYSRWQATHQCRISFWKDILVPSRLLPGLQKCTDGEDGEFRYHYVITQNLAPPALVCISRLKKERT